MSKFKEVKPEEFNESPFRLIGKDLMLITAERDGKVNTMTAGWDSFVVMWRKKADLTVIYDDGTPYFKEAAKAILCKKLFAQDYKPESFIEQEIIKKGRVVVLFFNN